MGTNFGLTTATPQVNIIQSINYLLATQANVNAINSSGNGNVIIGNTVVQANTSTGIVYTGNAGVISYLYNYVDIKYANSSTGGSGFSSNSSGTNYYGVFNTTSATESNNPVDYTWTQVAGGFGTTKSLWYTTGGGNTINFLISATQPNEFYSSVQDNTPILLSILAANVVTGNSIQSNTITGNNIEINTITGNLIATGTITGNLIQASTITGNLIQGNTITGNLIQGNTITGNLIQGNTITGNLIQASTITGNLIQANTITGNTIAAATITGYNIAAGTITANLLAAGTVIVSNSIQSTNATFGNNQSAGFWLDSNTGNVRFGGATSIGGNLNVTGLITQGNLANNVVYTNNLNQLVTFNISFSQNPTPGSIPLTYINGTAYWPDNTRGFPVGGGVSITPTSNGSTSGSRISVNYSTYLSSTDSPNGGLMELWKQSLTPFYENTFNSVSYVLPLQNAQANVGNIYAYNLDNWFTIVGQNGSQAWTFDGGNTISILTNSYGVPLPTLNSSLGWINWQDFNIYSNNAPAGHAIGPSSDIFSFAPSEGFGNLLGSTTGIATPWSVPPLGPTLPDYNGSIGSGGQIKPTGFQYIPYGTLMPTVGNNFGSTPVYGGGLMSVGSAGTIVWTLTQFSWYKQTSGTFADLYSIAQLSNPIVSNQTTTINTVIVGTGGTILNSNLGYTSGNCTSHTWTIKNSHTAQTLNAVASNYEGPDTTGNLFVAVGNLGTIVTSPDGQNWTLRNSGISSNLYGITYGGGHWIAVGATGTVITSTDGTSWSSISTPATGTGTVVGARDLKGIAYSFYSNIFLAAGTEIIMRTTSANVSNWTVQYTETASFTANLVRVQYYGSWSDANVTTIPSGNQSLVNGQILSGNYVDSNFINGVPVTYYLVAGNLDGPGGAQTYVSGASMTVTEYKR